jgi:hypothetical protein
MFTLLFNRLLFFNNVISFIQMLATISTPKVQASCFDYQNYMKYIQTKYNFYLIPFGDIYLFSI